MTKSFQKLLGTIFQYLLHLMHHSVMTNILFFPIFYLIAILHFLIVIIMRELKMRIWIYLLHFFFNLLARNPLVWWIHVCGNLDILVFFSYIHILQLHWDGVHFQLNIPNLYGFKGVFSLFFNILEYYTIVNLCGFLLFCVLVVIVPELILVIWKKTI